MRKFFTLKLSYVLMLLVSGAIGFQGSAQTTVFSDDFNRTTLSPGGTPSNTYTPTVATNVTAAITTNFLRVGSGTTAPPNGVSYVTGNIAAFASPFNTTLGSNTGAVTWTFNFRWNRAASNNPAPPASGSYSSVIVLAGSSATLTSGTGYAVVYGSSGTPDPIRLVSYSGGITGTLTNICTSGVSDLTATNNFASVRVVYDPSSNSWSLFVRDDGNAAWSDPSVGVTNQKGATTVNTSNTNIPLPAFGFVWTHATGTSMSTDIDNYKVAVNGAAIPTVTSIAPTSITAGGGAFTLIVNGTNFVAGQSTVTWNGANRTTTFVNANQLTASIPAADIANAGTAAVGVVTTGAASPSNTQTFTINAAATPFVSVSAALAGFGSLCINNTSTNSFTFDGTNLDGSNINIGALPGFSYSETIGGTYTGTLSFTYTGSGFTGKVIYVKFSPTAVQAYDGNIVVSGGGASNVSVPATGSGINTTATVTTVSNIVTGTAATLSGTISATGCSAVTSYGFEYSTTNGFANGTGTQVLATSLAAGNNFSKTVSGLTAGVTYFYKAFAVNSGGTGYGAQQSFTTSAVTPVIMASQPLLRYSEDFSDVANWTPNFVSGIGANRFSGVAVSGTTSVPNPVNVTAATNTTFSSGTSGGVQKGTGNIVLLATGSTDNNSSVAIDFYMDFTGVNAGTLSFDWASLNNSTGNRNGSLRVYATTDGVTFTEITSADVLNITNNTPSTGTVNSIALPASFNESPTARLRFYYYNGTGGGTPPVSGSRPKISIDNLTVTAINSAPCATPAAAPTSLNFDNITETTIHGTFVAASPAANEYLVVMSNNSSLTSNPLDGQTYTIGDNVGDGTVIAKGANLDFTATDLTGATTYFFFIFPINSVCTGGPKYLVTDPLSDDATTVAGLPSCTAPAAQATNLVTTASINSIQGSFTATAADEYLVLQSTSATLTGAPVNGIAYNSGAVIGNATVVQRGVNTSFNATGLTPATQYYYFVMSINSQGCVNGPVYNTVSPLSGTQTTQPLPVCATPSAQPTDIAFNASNNSVTATFNGAGTNYNYLVVMSSSPTLSAAPVDNTDYAVGSSLGGGTVVSNNTSTSFIATGLANSTTYYFFIFSANENCTGGTKYLTASPLSGNATTTNAPVNNIYFGNFHSHSDYSDGNKDHPGFTPADDYVFASASLGMDFLGISEHNHFSSVDNPGNEIANYHMGTTQAAAFNATHPNFLALYGMEWGVISGGGHVVVYGDEMNDLFGWESNVNGHVGPNYDVYVPKSTYIGPDGLFKTVNDYVAKNTFATLAHPNNTDYNNIANIPYDSTADAAITGSAVESGPATSTNITYSNPPSPMFYLWYFQKLLSKGYHLGPTIDHDNHNTTFGRTTTGRTAVIAPALTETEIVKAMRNMHFYATEDIDARVDFTINTRIMGSIFEDRNAPSISVNLTDPTHSTAGALIRLMFGVPGSGVNPVVIDSAFASSLGYVDNALPNHGTGYYYIDITFNGGKRIITSPIWYTRTCAAASDTTANVCGSFTWYDSTYTSSTTATKVFTTVGGCDSTVTLHLTINNSPASATIALAGSGTGCPGTGVALTASADATNGAITSYQWMKDGNPVATTATGNYTALASGSYAVTAVNAGNCSVVSGNSIAVTVADNTAPVADMATLPTLTGECSVTVSTVPTATDNCAGTINGTTTDPLTYAAQGTYTITWTYNDGNGNSSTQIQTVIVKDVTAPVLSGVPSNVSASCDNVPAAATTVTATDNCDASPVVSFTETNTQDADINSPAHYNYTITRRWTAADVNGNSSSQSQTITVTDLQSPVITSPSNITTINDAGVCGAAVSFAATATDNCSPVTISYSKAPGSVFAVGTTTVTVTATDISGNTSSVYFTVTVNDTEKPTITAPGAWSVPNDAGQCGATIASIGTPTTNDNCGVLSVTNDHPSHFYPVGTTIVTWTVTDIHGNVNDTTKQFVTVMDNELPTISVNNVSVGNDAGICGANVMLAAPVTADNCGVASVVNDHPSTFFATGTTAVHWTVTDNNGWTNTATQTVTVTDTEKPVVHTQNVTVYLDASGNATVNVAQVNNNSTDNCGISSYSLSKTNFNCSNLGANTVTLTVTDASGNANTATATITVKDNTAPTAIAQPITVYLNAGGTATVTAAQVNNNSTDNCGISSYSLSKTSFNCSNLGANTVTLTVTDASGNAASTTAIVTVKDNTAPTAAAQPVTVFLDAGGNATVTAAQVNNNSTDNCGISSYSLSKTSFNCSNLGANTVTLTVTDANGNAGSTTAIVTVKDNTAPTAAAQPVTVFLDASGNATVTAAQVNNNSTDNCSISSYSLSKTSFNCSNIGANTVTLTVTDASGNSSSTTAVVTVKDNTAPVITAVPNQVFCTNVAGNYTIPVLVATDNCGTVSVSYTITGATTRSGTGNNASGLFSIGVSTIHWTVTDGKGNTSTGTTTVTISALPAVTITAGNADAFCNQLTLSASAAGTGATYKWTSGTSTVANTQQIGLGQSNGDGIYQVTVTVNGCTSAPASYNFQKQNLVSSYTILAFDEINFGENNIVATGSIGVTGAKGEVDLGKGNSVASPGSFVKAKNIDKNGSNITIANPIYSAATGITLPTMLLNTVNTNGLPNKDVAQNSVSTVSGNYKNITLHKGSRTTLTGNTFGTIRVEQGAQVTFTSGTLNIDVLQVVKGPRYGYSYVRFSQDTKVMVSSSVTIGSQVYINPDNNNVTFYMGDNKPDLEKFTVNGGDTKVTANIYVPNGKLKVTGGYRYGDYGNGFGDCDVDDDDDRYYGQGTNYVYMTGLYIAEEVDGNGKNVVWNSFDCSSSPVPVLNNTTITQATTLENETATTDEDLKVTVSPNPSTTYFTLKIESKYATPVSMRVMDGRGRVVDARSEIGANSTIQIGHNYASGTYYAEMIQGTKRKVVQLIKVR